MQLESHETCAFDYLAVCWHCFANCEYSAKIVMKKFEFRKTFRFTVDYRLKVNYWRNSATHRIRGRYWVQPMSSHWISIQTNAKMMLVFKSIIQLSKVFKAVVERLLQNPVNLAVQSKMEHIQRTSNVIISLKCHAKMKPESNFSSWNSAWNPVALAISIMLKYVEPKKNKTNSHFQHNSMNDLFQIYEGSNINAPKVGRWCGNRIPPEYSSLSSELLIVFHTDFSFSDEGFRLKYETRTFLCLHLLWQLNNVFFFLHKI